MKAILTPFLILNLLLMLTLSGQAQSEDDYEYEYDHTYEYNHEYHYEWGMWGYRHEAKLIDSLSVLEMMDSLSREEVAYQWEDFQEKKQKARKEKKEKKKKKDKKKKKKGGRKTETGGRSTENGEGKEMGWAAPRWAAPRWAEDGVDASRMDAPVAPLDASLTAGLDYVAPLRLMNQVPDAQERAALVAIYNQMNGKNWTAQNNWLQGSSIEDIATWLGVTVENGDVVALELRRNGLTGGLPNTIANLSALEYLNLGGNAITSLPQQIEGLTNLKALYLDECQLANLPSGLGSLSKLETLYLNYNQLTSLPSTIEKLDALTAFYLYGNPLVTLPPQIGGLSSLVNLFLFQSSVTSLPDEIGQLKQLRGLFPKETQLTSLPATINNLTNLRYLNVADSKLKALPVMDKLNNLKGVIVSGNRLEQIPDWSSHPNIANLFWFVEENFIDLNQLAQNLTGTDTHPFVDFRYRLQSSPQEVLPVAGALLDPFPVKHPQSSYQWQRQVSGGVPPSGVPPSGVPPREWQDISGATAPTYTGEEGGLYRCRLTNAWLPGMIYYSHPLQPDVSGATTQWIEAECASIGSNWQVTADAQASGGEYVVYPQGEGAYRTAPSADPADQLVYTLTVEQAQDYYLLARINAPSYNDDSFWVKIDDKDWITWSGGIKVNQGFAWNQLPGGTVFLTQGTHTIIFTYREDGARLDKLSLSLSAELPSGQGEAALACESTGVAASQWVEAECASIGSNWTQAESSNASAGKYVVYPSGNYAAGPSTKAEDHLVYSLEIGEAQSYFLMARVNAPSYGDDSFWVKIDEQEWFPWGSGIKVNRGFQWNLVPGGALSLSAGSHTITFACREDGTQLDKLALRLTSALPTGLGEEAPECEDALPPYVAPAPPSLVNNPPDATTAPSVTGSRRPTSQSNSNVNYVRVYAPRTEISNPANLTMSSTVANVSVSTEYQDGQGRTVQTVSRGAGGSASQDIVQPITYDALGRVDRQYLPYATSSNTAAYLPNAVQEQYNFYTDGPSNVAQSDYPYAETKFEASPLSRVAEQGAPGQTYRLGAGHTVRETYRSNTSGDAVRRWTVSGDAPSTTTTYGAGTLYVTVLTDENNHQVTQFTNRQGQTVLKRVQGPDGNLDTYYAYDLYDQLRFTIPPQATQLLSGNWSQAQNSSFQAQWLFRYDYDDWGNMRAEHTPGGGMTLMIYDAWDRPVLSQSATMREQNAQQWAYTKYDYLDRAVVSGIYVTTSSEADLRESARSTTTRYIGTTTSGGIGYNLTVGFPSVSEGTVRSVSYYDNYGFPHADDAGYGAGGKSYRSKVKGLLTGGMSRKLDDNTWLKDVTYYDEQYRPIVITSDNHQGGTDRLTTQYRNTVNDEVLSSSLEHDGAEEHTIKQSFSYDHVGRLKSETHQLDGAEVMTLASHTYNALGQSVQKQMNAGGNAAGSQTVDYRYHIRGWLTKINDLNDANDYFAEQLYYDYGFKEKQYNGNVAGVQWARAGGTAQAYGYLYDAADRITGADYRKQTQGAWASSPGAYSVENIGYDKNGNIKSLRRYGEVEGNLYALDDLDYQYAGNRLKAVDEQGDGQAILGFLDGTSAEEEYFYDAGGNLTRDDNKGIEAISYDPLLNLPLEVRMKKGTIFYSYDASGNKLSQRVEDKNGVLVSKTDYAGAFEYRDSELSLLHHAEGRMSFVEGSDGNYHFDLKDHLGNIRVTFSDKPTTQAAMASMELGAAPLEEALFSGVAESRQTLAFHNTTDASIQEPEPNQVATLLPGQEGPSKSVAVQAGDTVHLQVNARYETSPSQVQGLDGIATEVAGAVEKTAAGLESQGAGGSLNGIAASGALATGQEASVPKAYLNYLLYDEEYQLLDQGYVQVSEAAAVGKNNPEATAEELSLDVPISEDGFLYTYLSYEGPAGSVASSPAASSSLAANSGVPANGPIANNNIPVYFDDFTIEQQSYIVAVHDLYPFGADFDQSLDRVVGLNGKYSYQGKELIADLNLAVYDFHSRAYDPLLGRFTSPDPQNQFASGYVGMGNNPVMGIDPNGEFVFAVPVLLAAIKAGAIIGASVGAASYGLNWAITGEGNAGGLLKSTALGALGGAVAGGVGNAISQLGVAAIGNATGLGAGLANLGFQATSTTASSIASNLVTGQNWDESFNIGVGPLTVPIRDGKFSFNPIDHVGNALTLYHHGRGFADATAGNANVSFDKTTLGFVFQAKNGSDGYVARTVGDNFGTARRGAVFLNSSDAIAAKAAQSDLASYLGRAPGTFSGGGNYKAYAAQALLNSPNQSLAVNYHEGTHIMQQRMMGNILTANLTYRFSQQSFNRSWQGYDFYRYYNSPFEREAFRRTYNIFFGQ